MRMSRRKRNKSLCKTDNKSITETTDISVEAMVLQHSVSPLSPNHFQHSSDSPGRKFFAGSRFSEAPNPSLLPKPPEHWMNAINIMNNSGDPMERVRTTNDINNHQVNGQSYGQSFNTSETKRNKSDKLIELKLLQILEASSIVNTSVNFETTRLLVKK